MMTSSANILKSFTFDLVLGSTVAAPICTHHTSEMGGCPTLASAPPNKKIDKDGLYVSPSFGIAK